MIPGTISVNPLMTVKDMSELLQKKPRTVREMCYKRQIPYLKVGGTIRFEYYEIAMWLHETCQIVNLHEENEQIRNRPSK